MLKQRIHIVYLELLPAFFVGCISPLFFAYGITFYILCCVVTVCGTGKKLLCLFELVLVVELYLLKCGIFSLVNIFAAYNNRLYYGVFLHIVFRIIIFSEYEQI